MGPGSRYILEDRKRTLALLTEELAALRFSILLTARWEGAVEGDKARRDELRAELKGLRSQYSEKIDEIAMTFGVQKAMDAQENVQRNVEIPLDLEPPLVPGEEDDRIF
jgi:hypothetical protein